MAKPMALTVQIDYETLTISFKHESLKNEFWFQLWPACRAMVVELNRLLLRNGWAEIVITQVGRTDEQMAEYYGDDWKEKGKFSWHLEWRAVDLRVSIWTPAQRTVIVEWLKAQWPEYEIILHDVGQGFHLHVATPRAASLLKRLRRWKTLRRERKLGRLMAA